MISTKQYILDIAMNLTRIGNWAADGYAIKQTRIIQFLHQTNGYVEEAKTCTYGPKFLPTINTFIPEFTTLYHEGLSTPSDTDIWAEKMMTWGTILTHRASLLL